MYLFRGLNYKAFAARLQKLCVVGHKPNIRAITEAIAQNGSVLRNLKVWIFYVVKNRVDYRKANTLAEQWSIPAQDVLEFSNINRTTLAYLRKLSRQFKALTLERLDQSVVTIVHDIRDWLGKFVSRKLRFVIQSQGLHRHDVENELLYKGVQGLYAMYPCVQTSLHAKNVVKRVIHNQGINMIHHFTTQKVGRLLRDATGTFSARVIALDGAQLANAVAPNTTSDLALDLARSMRGFKPKQRSFVELLCGAYSKEFTDWLVSVGGYSVDTNEELLDRLKPKRYIDLALRWLGIDAEAGARFLQHLQTLFTPYRIQA